MTDATTTIANAPDAALVSGQRAGTMRVVGDFAFGLALFALLACFFTAGGTVAATGPTLQPTHEAALIRTVAPAATPGVLVDTVHIIPAAFAFTTVSATPTASNVPLHSPFHPVNIALLALMFAGMTAINMALLRHTRLAYARARRPRT